MMKKLWIILSSETTTFLQKRRSSSFWSSCVSPCVCRKETTKRFFNFWNYHPVGVCLYELVLLWFSINVQAEERQQRNKTPKWGGTNTASHPLGRWFQGLAHIELVIRLQGRQDSPNRQPAAHLNEGIQFGNSDWKAGKLTTVVSTQLTRTV